MRIRKGQAAMEFLMTYGWAILAAVIVVGVLWYLIGNPANSAPERLDLTSPMVGLGWSFNTPATNQISVEIRNGLAESVAVSNFTIATCAPNMTVITVGAGATQVFQLSGCSLASVERFNEDVTIVYLPSGSTLNRTSTGTLNANVV